MPWTRGTQSTEVELSRMQSWIEQTDPELHGGRGEDKGVIRLFHEQQAEQQQRDRDIAMLMKMIIWVVGPGVLLSVVLQMLHTFHLLP